MNVATEGHLARKAEVDDDWPIHPLFPNMTKSERDRLRYIRIERKSTTGVYERCSTQHDADELYDAEVVVLLYGGGHYKFVAVDEDNRIYHWYPAARQGRIPFDLMTPSRPFAPRAVRPSASRREQAGAQLRSQRAARVARGGAALRRAPPANVPPWAHALLQEVKDLREAVSQERGERRRPEEPARKVARRASTDPNDARRRDHDRVTRRRAPVPSREEDSSPTTPRAAPRGRMPRHPIVGAPAGGAPTAPAASQRDGLPSPMRPALAPTQADDGWDIHLLFPEMTREERERLVSIGIERVSTDGTYARCPRRFSATELRDHAVVVERFGGGDYRFSAHNKDGRLFLWYPQIGRARIPLDLLTPSSPFSAAGGPRGPVPLNRQPVAGAPAASPPPPPVPNPNEPPPWATRLIVALEESSGGRRAIEMMNEAMNETMKHQVQMLCQSQAAMMQLLTAILTRKPDVTVGDVMQAMAQHSPPPDLKAMWEIAQMMRPRASEDPVATFERIAAVLQKSRRDNGGQSAESAEVNGVSTALGATANLGGEPSEAQPCPARPAYPGRYYDYERGAWIEPASPPRPRRRVTLGDVLERCAQDPAYARWVLEGGGSRGAPPPNPDEAEAPPQSAAPPKEQAEHPATSLRAFLRNGGGASDTQAPDGAADALGSPLNTLVGAAPDSAAPATPASPAPHAPPDPGNDDNDARDARITPAPPPATQEQPVSARDLVAYLITRCEHDASFARRLLQARHRAEAKPALPLSSPVAPPAPLSSGAAPCAPAPGSPPPPSPATRSPVAEVPRPGERPPELPPAIVDARIEKLLAESDDGAKTKASIVHDFPSAPPTDEGALLAA